MYMLVGNHDICYRHTLEINSPDLLLGEYKNITVINKPTQIDINGTKIDIVPWLCDENEADITTFMSRKGKGDICCGHFELSGFPMYKGVDSSHGTVKSMKMFDGYDRVFSGHYHTKSEKGNITYTGIPYEITWSDYADPKGFYVYDTTTGKYEFIRNPLTMFEKIVYNNGQKTDISTLKGKIVKILTHEKKDAVLYERWLDSIRLVQPYEFNIVENDAVQLDGELDDSIEIEDTSSIIKNYIDQIETSVSKDDLNKYMQALYFEALTLDDSI